MTPAQSIPLFPADVDIDRLRQSIHGLIEEADPVFVQVVFALLQQDLQRRNSLAVYKAPQQ